MNEQDFWTKLKEINQTFGRDNEKAFRLFRELVESGIPDELAPDLLRKVLNLMIDDPKYANASLATSEWMELDPEQETD